MLPEASSALAIGPAEAARQAVQRTSRAALKCRGFFSAGRHGALEQRNRGPVFDFSRMGNAAADRYHPMNDSSRMAGFRRQASEQSTGATRDKSKLENGHDRVIARPGQTAVATPVGQARSGETELGGKPALVLAAQEEWTIRTNRLSDEPAEVWGTGVSPEYGG